MDRRELFSPTIESMENPSLLLDPGLARREEVERAVRVWVRMDGEEGEEERRE